jgi:threonine synthase
MRFVSTRDRAHDVDLTGAIRRGLAPDGGLYVPDSLPALSLDCWSPSPGLGEAARTLLTPFFAGDSLQEALPDIVDDAFDFPAPLIDVPRAPGPLSVLELFHGPTAAFKDFGARFLAAALERMPAFDDDRRVTILVATSGDTGGAVAAAFYERPWVDVVVLYPHGLVSPRQAQQLACWGRNVRTIAIDGVFDDCQQLVKQAFADRELASRLRLTSANSINVGRLLPQMVYYAASSLALWRRDGRPPGYIVPTGNLGNVLACIWAREIGLPIGDIVLATNANRAVPDYLRSGAWEPRASVATLASAMDVGNPSNMERLRGLFPGDAAVSSQVEAMSVDDDEIRATIARDDRELDQTWCPHTATAAAVYRRLASGRRTARWVLVATAHPAKFNDIVEPLIGREVPVPPGLARLLALPRIETRIAAQLDAFRSQLLDDRK